MEGSNDSITEPGNQKSEEIQPSEDITWKIHHNFLFYHYNFLPQPYQSQDSNRVTLAYFVFGAMDLLNIIDHPKLKKQDVIDWIYSLQILPGKDREKNKHNFGFRGSNFFVTPQDDSACECTPHIHDKSHVAMSFVAISILLMMGDDLSRIDTKSVIASLPFIQQPNGSFSPTSGGAEFDMRYVYCAASVCYMLNDWSTFNIEKATEYIISSQGYDSGIGQAPLEESHAGSSFCAIAALKLMGTLEKLPYKAELVKWLVMRQALGFQGRPNKLQDTCYSFWVGASLCILGHYDLIDGKHSRNFTLSCQYQNGGFAKWPNTKPDVLHTYLSFCGLSFSGEPGIMPVNPVLCLSQRAVDRLNRLHEGKEGFVPL